MAWKGALSQTLQELRVHLCQTSPASVGARAFVVENFAEIKRANPYFPFLVREAAGAEAKLIARFDFGVEKTVSIQNDKPAEIIAKLTQLMKGT
ncbi:MAG: hypothetical protein WDW38_003545 [Sanguina aurantia]